MTLEVTKDVEIVERQRILLEDNLAKLTRSLRHWQTWEAEYEGLKEEILALEGEPDSDALLRVGREFGGSLVNEEEIKALLGITKRSQGKSKQAESQRSRKQVMDLTSRRQDYVQQNIRTLQKQIEGLENQLEELLSATEPEAFETGDEALPLTDITEHLDDHDNVISFTTSNAAEAEPKVREVLQKAGIEDIKQGNSSPESSQNGVKNGLEPKHSNMDTLEIESKLQNPASETEALNDAHKKPGRKSVSFAEDTKPVPPNNELQMDSTGAQGGLTALEVAKDLPPGARLIELDDDDYPIGTTTVVSKAESPEDAALRREMLQYNMEQVGAVVAELDLEDGFSDGTYDDYEDDLDDLDSSDRTSDLDDEDQFGRTTRRVVTDDYRKEMLELEKKLDARMIEVVGPSPNTTLPESGTTEYTSDGNDAVQGSTTSLGTEQPRKKSVSFAEEIDVATPSNARASQQKSNASDPKSSLKSRSTTERKSALDNSTLASSESTRASRSKSGRQSPAQSSTPQEPPSGPKDQILASDLVERQSTRRPAAVADSDGFDPILHQREIARQYYDKRNQLIQQQGGFMPSSEEIESPLMEEKDGKIKKVSRFRAARLNASGI